jgi:hypothetical protein
MTIPESLAAALIGVFAVVLAGVLADVGIWRRSLSRDIRRLTERVAVVETAIHYMSPAAHRRAKREVEDSNE